MAQANIIYGGWWGLGQSGETDSEGGGLPTDGGGFVDFGSGEMDPSTVAGPGYNIPTAPGVELSPTELAAEQARARAWLAQLPNVISTGARIALTASQISAAAAAGAIKPSSTCPSGYVLADGRCVERAAQPAGQWIAGVSNNTLLLVGAGFLFLMILSSAGGRRR